MTLCGLNVPVQHALDNLARSESPESCVHAAAGQHGHDGQHLGLKSTANIHPATHQTPREPWQSARGSESAALVFNSRIGKRSVL